MQAAGATAAADLTEMQSPETYLGYAKAVGNINEGGADRRQALQLLRLAPSSNSRWALDGIWTVGAATGDPRMRPTRVLTYRFLGRDLHLVLGPAASGKPVRFRVTLDGKPPGADHGADTDAQGVGKVTDHRLYQLVRQKNPKTPRTFEIEFLDPGAQAFAFTFG